MVSYIILEEKIRLKKYKYQKHFEEFTEQIQKFDRNSKQFKDERTNKYGVSDNSELKIKLVRINLKHLSLFGMKISLFLHKVKTEC